MSHRPSPFRTRPTAGFTIVEVMMAATILVVGFVAMLEAVTITSGMLDHARRQTLATQILSFEVDDLRTASWTTISGLPTTSTSVAIDSQFDTAITASGATYTVTRTVTTTDPMTDVREVNFTVTWTVTTSRRKADGSRVTFTFSRSTSAWFGQYGLNLSYQRS